jgi:hypothetical protein
MVARVYTDAHVVPPQEAARLRRAQQRLAFAKAFNPRLGGERCELRWLSLDLGNLIGSVPPRQQWADLCISALASMQRRPAARATVGVSDAGHEGAEGIKQLQEAAVHGVAKRGVSVALQSGKDIQIRQPSERHWMYCYARCGTDGSSRSGRSSCRATVLRAHCKSAGSCVLNPAEGPACMLLRDFQEGGGGGETVAGVFVF